MHKYLIIISATITMLQGGIGDARLILLSEVRGSAFRSEAPNFGKIYGDEPRIIPVAALGIGYKDVFVVARYNLIEADGQSLVTGIDLEGTATWREEIFTLGIRTYETRPFYLELAYALGVVEESISTEQPEKSALNSSVTIKDNRGVSAAIGLMIPLIAGIHLTGELGLLYMPIEASRVPRDRKVNIGGAMLSIGISVVL